MTNHITTAPPTYIVDGLNLCLYNKKRASLDALMTLLLELKRRNASFTCMFDGVTQYRLPEEQRSHYKKLIDDLSSYFSEITGGIPADDFILLKADSEGSFIISNDQYREYLINYPWLKSDKRLVKWNVAGDTLQVASLGINIRIQRDVESGVRDLVALLQQPSPIYQKEEPLNGSPELAPNSGYISKARLMVFALDASGSMWNSADGADKTYDGRLKSDHLNEVLREVIQRLSISMARDSFYIAVVNFAGHACIKNMGGKSILNITEAKSQIVNAKFNYLDGANGSGTDIAGAVRISKQLIDNVLELPGNLKLHDEWHALIILITDGRHTGDVEDVKKVARQAAIANSTLANGNIRIAAVGIGSDCDAELLKEISAEADPTELSRLRVAQLDDLLLEKRLAVVVSEKNSRYVKVIRNFVDIVTETF